MVGLSFAPNSKKVVGAGVINALSGLRVGLQTFYMLYHYTHNYFVSVVIYINTPYYNYNNFNHVNNIFTPLYSLLGDGHL